MAFKTRQQARHNQLKRLGFLPFEALELSGLLPRTTLRVERGHKNVMPPYVVDAIKERRDAFRSAKKMGLSRGEWIATIKDMYIDHEWFRAGKPDFWAMFRSWEDEWRRRHPDYESPQEFRKPRPKKTHDEYVSKYAKGLEAYEMGRYR